MDCPRCHTPLKPAAKQGFLRDVLAVFGFGTISAQKPNLRCPQCRTEVVAPREDGPVLSVDHLEDYRKLCWQQWKASRDPVLRLGAIPPEYFAEEVARLERFLRFLEALTPEERLQPERIGEAERERARLASGTTAEDVGELFAEFEQLREAFEKARDPANRPVVPWSFHAPVAVGLLAGAAAYLVAQFNPVAVTVLCVLGYAFLSANVAFILLSFSRRAVIRVLMSRVSSLVVFRLIPLAVGVALYFLVHDAAILAGLDITLQLIGCVAVVAWVTSDGIRIATGLYTRKLMRQAREQHAKEQQSGTPAAP